MSLLGIGSARIDLVLEKRTYVPRETVSGHFLLKGGTVDQIIKHIHCDLVIVDDEKEQETVVDTTMILSSRKIQSNEEDQLLFSFTIPKDSERSRKNLYYYFKSKLVFHEGIESKEHNIIYLKTNM